MAEKKSASKKDEKKDAKPVTKATAKKQPTKKMEQKKKNEPCGCQEEHEHDDTCMVETEALFGKNAQRSYALRDLWFESLSQVVDEQVAPEPNKREMMFLTLSNAMLDMMMDILPEDLALIMVENLDDYLAVTLVNRKFDVDLLNTFQDEFVKENGDKFDDQEKLMEALEKFQDKFWDSGRKDLGGKSPNQAVEEALKKYDLN